MTRSNTETVVKELPKCDFCEQKARYNGKTKMKPWAYMCAVHFGEHGIGLGLGMGQKLVLKGEPAGETQAERFVEPTGRNRVRDRIKLQQAKIDSGNIPKEKLDNLDKALKTDLGDLFQYQQLQATAHAQGLLSTDEAELVYKLLGGEVPSEEKWDKLSIPEKVAITQVMDELLQMKLKAAGHTSSTAQKKGRKSKRNGPGGLRELRS